MNLTVGDPAPAFVLPDQDGSLRRLSDYAGRWVLLYFYPKDDTPGCTTEACSLRDNLPRFGGVAAQILGVSADSVASHKKFADKNHLPFPLLADEGHGTLEAYGVWGEKSLAGKKYLGISRTSFLIDPAGRLAKIYKDVKPAEHAAQVLQDLTALQG